MRAAEPQADRELAEAGITMELLRLFTRIAGVGGIAPAARELDMSPSVATRKLARLEKSFGARLFVRTTRSLRLTESGALALRWAQQSLERYERVAEQLSGLRSQPTGTIKLAIHHTAALRFLPQLLKRFCDEYPSIRLSLSLSDDPLKLLKEGFDLAIHGGFVPDRSLVARRLVEYQPILCASPEYLKRRGVPRRVEDLAEHDCLVHALAGSGNWFFMQGSQLVSQTVNALVEADSLDMLIALACEGLGIVRIGRNTAVDEITAGLLTPVLSEYKSVSSTGTLPGLWMVYSSRRMLGTTRALVEFIADGWEANIAKSAVRAAL
jgi:DNA-binding transcriptional LysR family regulator